MASQLMMKPAKLATRGTAGRAAGARPALSLRPAQRPTPSFVAKARRRTQAALHRLRICALLPDCGLALRPPVQASAVAGEERAILHDFCLAIPYAGAATVLGVLGIANGWGAGDFAVKLASAGIAVAVTSILSYKSWSKNSVNTSATLVSAGTLPPSDSLAGGRAVSRATGKGCHASLRRGCSARRSAASGVGQCLQAAHNPPPGLLPGLQSLTAAFPPARRAWGCVGLAYRPAQVWPPRPRWPAGRS